MNISLISTNYYMSGSYINFLDLQHYLVNEGKHQITFFYTQLDKNGYWLPHMIRKTRRDYDFGEKMKLYGNIWINEEVIITDFRGLVVCKKWEIPLVCSRLIVMDSVELSYHLNGTEGATNWFDWDFSYETDMYEYLDLIDADEMIFLMPKVNVEPFQKRYPDLKPMEFYKKINYDALKTAPIQDNGKFCYRTDNPGLVYNALEKIDFFDNLDEQPEGSLFDYRGFIFHRRDRLRFWEQFGRLIFEYIMLGKEVRFAEDPFKIHDGLVDYLHHYGIEFDEQRNVTTSKDELIKQMISYEDAPWD